MDKMINYGIDLGTTNSVIAKFVKGKIEVFRNPQDYGRETLPSVVYFKKDKVIVGNQAKVFLERGDPSQVFGRFKRLLGTTETKRVKVLNSSKTPVELSAEVLKELKHICIKGFMAMASNTDNTDQIIQEFKSLKQFSLKFPELSVLSFGMSSDYTLAIQEGTTMIRIGSHIFGTRNYTK